MKIILAVVSMLLLSGCDIIPHKELSVAADITFVNGNRTQCKEFLMRPTHISWAQCADGNEYSFQTNFVIHNPKEVEQAIRDGKSL